MIKIPGTIVDKSLILCTGIAADDGIDITVSSVSISQ